MKEALSAHNPDWQVWLNAYNEEFDGLSDLNVHSIITEEEYKEYVRKHGEAAMAIPTMNLFMIKNDKEGNPVRAKSRIVALGNLEKRIWSRGDRYASVLSSTASQLLLSMAVSDGCKLKQGDYKYAFCNGIFPEYEICIVKPPLGYPQSTGSYWKLNRTLYGLCRSDKH